MNIITPKFGTIPPRPAGHPGKPLHASARALPKNKFTPANVLPLHGHKMLPHWQKILTQRFETMIAMLLDPVKKLSLQVENWDDSLFLTCHLPPYAGCVLNGSGTFFRFDLPFSTELFSPEQCRQNEANIKDFFKYQIKWAASDLGYDKMNSTFTFNRIVRENKLLRLHENGLPQDTEHLYSEIIVTAIVKFGALDDGDMLVARRQSSLLGRTLYNVCFT